MKHLFHRPHWGIWELITIHYWDGNEPVGTEDKQRCRCLTCGRYKIRRIGRR